MLSFIPDLNSTWMPLITFFVYIAVNWWASWYPGAEPGGGGYVAQRMFSAKDEKNSLLATLWFNIAHFAIRPWPWILTALASLVLFPNLADKETGYIRVMVDVSSALLAGPHDRGVCGGVHVHDRDPTELGSQLHGQRLLPAISEAARNGPPLCRKRRSGPRCC